VSEASRARDRGVAKLVDELVKTRWERDEARASHCTGSRGPASCQKAQTIALNKLLELAQERDALCARVKELERLLAYLGGRLAVDVKDAECVPTQAEFMVGIERYAKAVRAKEKSDDQTDPR